MVTIIYYTANTEEEQFERKVRENILKVTNLPIISVSRKPIDFGKNICVGEKPVCYSNEWKQLLIGLREAKTEFCIAAESDFLYSPDYFTFIPPVKDKIYRYANVWAFWENKRKFWRKPRSEGAQICGRKYWISRLEQMLGKNNSWKPRANPGEMVSGLFGEEGRWTGSPIITFKTKHNISNKTSLSKVPSVKELPYWGDSLSIYERMFL